MGEEFIKFYRDDITSDVTLIVDDTKFPTHKFVLFIKSEVFKNMFFTDMKESKEDMIEIKDTSAETFEVLLKYCYTNQFDKNSVHSDHNLGLNVYKLAHRFMIKGLMSLCADVIVSLITCENLVTITEFCNVYEVENIITGIKRFIQTKEKEVLSFKYPPTDDYKTIAKIFRELTQPQSRIITAIRDICERNGENNSSQFKTCITLSKCKVAELNPLRDLKLFSHQELYNQLECGYNNLEIDYNVISEAYDELLSKINKISKNDCYESGYPCSVISALKSFYEDETENKPRRKNY